MSLRLPNGRAVKLSGQKIGEGAEGMILGVDGTMDVCAKIYYEPAPDIADRLAALTRHPAGKLGGDSDEHFHAAWPIAPLADDDGATLGFLMPFVHAQPLIRLFDPATRFAAIDQPTWRAMLTVASRTARLLSMLHPLGIVVGDVSPNNLMVSSAGLVTLIDCDAVQFTDADTGRRHPSPKLSPEYSPPEISARQPWLSREHDLFGLAVLVYQLLMEGEHPFVGIPAIGRNQQTSPQDNIRLQNNRVTHPERLIATPDDIPHEVLPLAVRELATRCFGPGHTDPDERPAASEWADALDQAGFDLMGCRLNERHVYHSALTSCVWCDLLGAGHGERYPSSQAPAYAPPAVTVAPPAPAATPARAPAQVPAAKSAAMVAVLGWLVIIVIIALAILAGLGKL